MLLFCVIYTLDTLSRVEWTILVKTWKTVMLRMGALAKEVSEEKNVSMWPRDY